MRVSRLLIVAAFLAICVSCATNPTNKWAQARETVTAFQDTVRIAVEAGVLTVEDARKANPFVQAARAALERAENYLPEGGTRFDYYMDLVDAMLERLEEMALLGQLGTQSCLETPADRVAYATARLTRLEAVHGS